MRLRPVPLRVSLQWLKELLEKGSALLESLVHLVGRFALWFAISKEFDYLCWLQIYHVVELGAMVEERVTVENDCCCYCSGSAVVGGIVVHGYAWEGEAD